MNQKASERQAHILAAATTCFAKRGFHQTSMDDIAREAGISAGLIYRHFASKDDLIVALVEAYTRDELALLDQAEAQPHIADALALLVEAEPQQANWQVDGTLVVEVMAEALRNERVAAVVRRTDETLTNGLAHLIAQAQANEQIDPTLSPMIVADVLLALNDGILMHQALADEQKPYDDDAFLATVKTLYTRFLGLSDHQSPATTPPGDAT